MNLREEIVEKVQNIPEQFLGEFNAVIEDFVQKKSKPTFMERLRQIKIEGLPPDYSRNIDLYLNGEKKIDEDFD